MLFATLKNRIISISFKFFGFTGITVYPFIFVAIKPPYGSLINHELVHFQQQEKFWKVAGPLGILAWVTLYYAWRPFRYKMELEAYTMGSGLSDSEAWKRIKDQYFKRQE